MRGLRNTVVPYKYLTWCRAWAKPLKGRSNGVAQGVAQGVANRVIDRAAGHLTKRAKRRVADLLGV